MKSPLRRILAGVLALGAAVPPARAETAPAAQAPPEKASAAPPALRSYLLEPNYRGWMYGGWPSALRLKLLVERPDNGPDAPAPGLRATLTDGAGQEVLAVSREADRRMIDWAIALPHPLDPGDYLLRVSLIERPGGKVLADHEHPLVQWKGETPGAKCWIDRHQRFIVDGKPFFPLGMFAECPGEEDLKMIAGAGFNCLMPYYLYGQTGQTIEAQKKYLADSERIGLKTIYSTKDIYSDWAINHLAQLHGWPADKEAILTRVVETHRDDPNIIAWYINDEMGVADVPKIKDHYRLTRRLDPNHPIWMVDYRPEVIREFWDTSDVFGVDWYPIAWLHISTTGQSTAQARAQLFNARPRWDVAQAHNLGIYNVEASTARAPTYEEMRNMAWQFLCNGATGLILYLFDDLKRDPKATFEQRWPDVKKVAAELKEISPILLSVDEPQAVKVDGATVRWFAKALGNTTHVFLVNTAREPASATLTLAKPGLPVKVDGVARDMAGDSLMVELPAIGVARVEITP
jgi:hypothetical protein